MDIEIGATKYGKDFIEAIDASTIDDVLETIGENISVDVDGIYTANFVFTAKYRNAMEIAKETENHPRLGELKKTNWAIQRVDGDLARATLVFKGVEEGAYYVRYGINSATQAQPIETHPFFDEGEDIPDDADSVKDDEDAYGYRFGDPIESGAGGGQGSRQAIFEVLSSNKIFKGFPLNSKFDLQGVTQYLDVGMTLRCTIVTYAEDGFKTQISDLDIKKGGGIYYVGQIAEPPTDIAPDLDKLPQIDAGGISDNFNWLVTKCDTEIIGSAFRQQVEFTLSGYLGWNRLIYNKVDDAFGNIDSTRYDKNLPEGGGSASS